MSRAKDKTSKTKILIQDALLWGGLFLVFGWSFIIGLTSLGVNLPCLISPDSCSDGKSMSNIILFLPVIVGCLAAPAGVLYDMKLARESKFFIALAVAIVLYFLAQWTMSFAAMI